VVFAIPQGIDVAVEKNTRITVSGPDRQQVGQVASEIRNLRPPDIYQGKGVTLASVSSLEPELKSQLGKGTGNLQAAKLVGATLAERAKTAGIGKVVFDRGGYVYHGKVKALAEAAREKGLDF
jgi:ribosomal protein L18